MPSNRSLSNWAKFKNWVSGMTEEERELNQIEERLWHIEKILHWNSEIGRKHFNEDSIREEMAAIKKQVAKMRRRLPEESKMRTGPWLGRLRQDPFYELEAQIKYLREILYINRANPHFPILETTIRLRVLEEQLNLLRPQPPPVIVSIDGSGPRGPPRGWQPPPVPASRWPPSPVWKRGIPTGAAVPLSPWPASPIPTGEAVPMSPWSQSSGSDASSEPATPIRGPFGRAKTQRRRGA